MYIKFFDWNKVRDEEGVFQNFNNLANKLIDFRFAEVQKALHNLMYKEKTTIHDTENTQHIVRLLDKVYSAEEYKKFEEKNYLHIPCVLYGYNVGSSFGSGRVYTIQPVSDMGDPDALPSQMINPIWYFKAYLEVDKILNFLEGTPYKELFQIELNRYRKESAELCLS